MLQVFVFASVTDVIITRHRQNTYVLVYARRRRRAMMVAAAVDVEGSVCVGGDGVAVAVAGGADSVAGGEIEVGTYLGS
jgi:hypothetical protein